MNETPVATLGTPADAPPEGVDLPLSPTPDPPRRRRSRSLERVLTIGFTVLAAILMATFTIAQLHPRLLVTDSTPAGGDMGAHVWGPAYLRDHLLPQFRLAGWSPDWYAGFPAYQFYMVMPALAIVVLNLVLPYGIAFKLITVSGLVAMPFAAAATGRLFRLPFPGPALMAVATLPFLFDTTFTIYGGNVASTLAGEFAFSMSLSVCVLYLGLLSGGLETGRYRAITAATLGLAILLHPLPGIFFALPLTVAVMVPHLIGTMVAGVRAVPRPEAGRRSPLRLLGGAWTGFRTPMWWVISAGAVGGLLTCFWVLPFIWRRPYLNDMGWERLPTARADLLRYLFHMGADGNKLTGFDLLSTMSSLWLVVVVAALVGAVLSFAYRERIGIVLTLGAVLMGVLFATVPQARLWNARLLPFFYLCLYLLAAVGVALLAQALRTVAARAGAATIVGLVVVMAVALPLGSLPGASHAADGRWEWLGMKAKSNFVGSWAKWNYAGYEGKDAYPEYYGVVSMMDDLGRKPENGCGRAMWEYDNTRLNSYGTPMALMLLPHWTDGCIGSMEGLFFESSATTPYHFLNQSTLSAQPSRPQRDLPYKNFDIKLGVQQLQLMGVRYYLAYSQQAKDAAAAEPELTEVASSGPWTAFQVADAPLVEGMDNQPVVLDDIHQYQHDWLPIAANLFNDPTQWNVLRAATGPEAWQRVASTDAPPETPVQDVEVTDIETGNHSMSFTVDQIGQPVLVKTSYFPNWKADGADGPYRVMPNLMVVVPTANKVTLSYGQTPVDIFAWLLALLGVAGLVILAWRPPLPVDRIRRRALPAGPGPAGYGPDPDPAPGSGVWPPPFDEGNTNGHTNGNGAGHGSGGPDTSVFPAPPVVAGAVGGAALASGPDDPTRVDADLPAEAPAPVADAAAAAADDGRRPTTAAASTEAVMLPSDAVSPVVPAPAAPTRVPDPAPPTWTQAAEDDEWAVPMPSADDAWLGPVDPAPSPPTGPASSTPGGAWSTPVPPSGAPGSNWLDDLPVAEPDPSAPAPTGARSPAADPGDDQTDGDDPGSWLGAFAPPAEDGASSVSWTDRDEPEDDAGTKQPPGR